MDAWNMNGTAKYKITKRNGTWGEWESEFPLMTQNVEYRTTERVFGNAVYKKLFYFGFLPNSTELGVPHGVTGMTQLAKVTLLPYGLATNPDRLSQVTKVNVDATKVYITTSANLSSTRCYVILEYAKA